MRFKAGQITMELTLPVVFFDGEQETGLGEVVVSPPLNFRDLQLTLAKRIGISPHQFSIFLADKNSRGARVPITVKTDFSAISGGGGDHDCFVFLVVLKRSRRGMRRHESYCVHPAASSKFNPLPGNVMLLRRDVTHSDPNGLFSGLEVGRAGYERRVRELEMEKERYLMKVGGDGLGSRYDEGRRTLSFGEGNDVVECEECLRSKQPGSRRGSDADGFHLCILDAVTVGFRSRAGPIARPAKWSG